MQLYSDTVKKCLYTSTYEDLGCLYLQGAYDCDYVATWLVDGIFLIGMFPKERKFTIVSLVAILDDKSCETNAVQELEEMFLTYPDTAFFQQSELTTTLMPCHYLHLSIFARRVLSTYPNKKPYDHNNAVRS